MKNSEFVDMLNQTIAKINENQPEVPYNKVLYISHNIYDDFIKQFSIAFGTNIQEIEYLYGRRVYKDYHTKNMIYFGDPPIIKREDPSKTEVILKNNNSTL